MDNAELERLVSEAASRGGGMLLNVGDKPAAVVLTVDKYNELLRDPHAARSPRPSGTPAQRSESKRVLVTGGAGYIGAHVARQLLVAGYQVTVLDNLSAGRREHVPQKASFIEGDLADLNLLRDVMAAGNFQAVCHLAASIEVEESVREPQRYFENNVLNTERLLLAMREAGVLNLVFSSTAAVYGEQEKIPIAESALLGPNNPYGHSKMLCEQVIEYYARYAGLRAVVFRYFNACGSDYDGEIGLTHRSHLIPAVLEVAAGQRPQISVYGNDYPTFDGTCVRDYVHVLDIAKAHLLALDRLAKEPSPFSVYNIGTGKGWSVSQIIGRASEILNRIIPMEIASRRPGDAAATVADGGKFVREFGFQPEYSDLDCIINTSWNQLLRGSARFASISRPDNPGSQERPVSL